MHLGTDPILGALHVPSPVSPEKVGRSGDSELGSIDAVKDDGGHGLNCLGSSFNSLGVVVLRSGDLRLDVLPERLSLLVPDESLDSGVVLRFYRESIESLLPDFITGQRVLEIQTFLSEARLELLRPFSIDRTRSHAATIISSAETHLFLEGAVARQREHGTFDDVFKHSLGGGKGTPVFSNRKSKEHQDVIGLACK